MSATSDGGVGDGVTAAGVPVEDGVGGVAAGVGRTPPYAPIRPDTSPCRSVTRPRGPNPQSAVCVRHTLALRRSHAMEYTAVP